MADRTGTPSPSSLAPRPAFAACLRELEERFKGARRPGGGGGGGGGGGRSLH